MRFQAATVLVRLLQFTTVAKACDFYHTETPSTGSDAVYDPDAVVEDLAHDNLNDPHQPRSLNELHRRAAAEPRDWTYTNSSSWGDIKSGSCPQESGMTNTQN